MPEQTQGLHRTALIAQALQTPGTTPVTCSPKLPSSQGTRADVHGEVCSPSSSALFNANPSGEVSVCSTRCSATAPRGQQVCSCLPSWRVRRCRETSRPRSPTKRSGAKGFFTPRNGLEVITFNGAAPQFPSEFMASKELAAPPSHFAQNQGQLQ